MPRPPALPACWAVVPDQLRITHSRSCDSAELSHPSPEPQRASLKGTLNLETRDSVMSAVQVHMGPSPGSTFPNYVDVRPSLNNSFFVCKTQIATSTYPSDNSGECGGGLVKCLAPGSKRLNKDQLLFQKENFAHKRPAASENLVLWQKRMRSSHTAPGGVQSSLQVSTLCSSPQPHETGQKTRKLGTRFVAKPGVKSQAAQ